MFHSNGKPAPLFKICIFSLAVLSAGPVFAAGFTASSRGTKTDPVTGWSYVPDANFTLSKGEGSISLDSKENTVNIWAVSPKKIRIPLLSTSAGASYTNLYLRFAGKEYPLVPGKNLTVETRRTTSGVQISYEIPKKAQVTADFAFMPSGDDPTNNDILMVSIYVINLTNKSQQSSLKVLYNTYLGENSSAHFSTSQGSLGGNHTFYTTKKIGWITSGKADRSISFILNGKGITAPTTVMLAPITQLTAKKWAPSVTETSKNTPSSDTGLLMIWPEIPIEADHTLMHRFYIAIDGDNNPVNIAQFVENLEKGNVYVPEQADANWLEPMQETANMVAPSTRNMVLQQSGTADSAENDKAEDSAAEANAQEATSLNAENAAQNDAAPAPAANIQEEIPAVTENTEPVPVQTEAIQAEPLQTETVQAEPVQTALLQSNPVRTETEKAEPLPAEPVQETIPAEKEVTENLTDIAKATDAPEFEKVETENVSRATKISSKVDVKHARDLIDYINSLTVNSLLNRKEYNRLDKEVEDIINTLRSE